MSKEVREHTAVYGPLSLNVEEEHDKKPKESIVLFLSALGGELILFIDIFRINLNYMVLS